MSDPTYHQHSFDQTREVLERVIRQNPHTRNATNGRGNCRYTSETDPDHHCLAGQVAVELGHEVPGPDKGGNVRAYHVFTWNFETKALDLLQVAQRAADRHDAIDAGWRPVEWSTIDVQDLVARLDEGF